MAAKSRIWDFRINCSSIYDFFSFREGMYLVSVATFPEGLLLSGVVKHLRKFID